MNGDPLVILLVEDNEDHAELIIRNLESAHVANRLFHVDNGESALHFLYGQGIYKDRSAFPKPNLILLDLRLPKIDGLEVLRKIKQDEHLMYIPVVILTTSDAEQDIAKAYLYHANSYLTKPVDFLTFTQLMKDLGYYWLCWNKRPWDLSFEHTP